MERIVKYICLVVLVPTEINAFASFSLQVRLADGSRLIVKLNQSATVSDLRSYINTARPQYSGLNYALLTTFPNKEITDDSLTISAAGLVGAAVLQRLK